jgi:sugar diacid utilization regulator
VESGLGPTALELAGMHLLTALDPLVDEITTRVWQSVPAYNDILTDRAALEEQVRPNIQHTLEFMSSGRDIDDDDRKRLNVLGRTRALQGIPLSGMIQSWRVAERVLIDAFCVFCIRAGFNSAEQRNGIRAISAILDKAEVTTAEAYVETYRHLQKDHTDSVAVLVTRLVDGSAGDRVEIDAQARLIGANPSVPYRCIALTAVSDNTDEDQTARLSRLRRHLLTRLIEARNPMPIVGVRDNALILLIPAGERDALAVIRRALDPLPYRFEVVAGVGDLYESLSEARMSCHQALMALEVGLRRRRGNEVVMYGDVVVDVMLLTNPEAAHKLISSHLRALESHPQLIETISEYLNLSMSAQATATRLVVHVNTIAYRLRRVRELTGHDVRNPTDAIGFSLALRAQGLLAS